MPARRTHALREEPPRLPPHAAARVLTQDAPTAHPEQTLQQVRDSLAKTITDSETINYIYVLDSGNRLTGILSIKDLFRFQADTKIGNLCRTEKLITVHPDTPQERVAYLALRHNIKAIPVVDRSGVYLGVIPSDAILRILYRETHEDLLHLAGIHRGGSTPFDSVLTLPLLTSVWHRLPWLLLGLAGGLLAAQLVAQYEETLRANLLLAAFIPLIVYMSDAVGTQMEAFIIRDMAVEHRLPFLRYLTRQIAVIAIISLLLGGSLFLIANFLHGNARTSVVLGVSLSAAVLSSVLTGLIIPYVFSRMRLDPANASGPTATILQDLLSILVYFSIAEQLL